MLISALNAMHRPVDALVWNLLRLFALLLPLAWLGSTLHGTKGLFIGIAVANALSGLTAYLYAVRLAPALACQTHFLVHFLAHSHAATNMNSINKKDSRGCLFYVFYCMCVIST